MPGEDFLKELAQDLTVSEKTSPLLRKCLAPIFNNLLAEKMGDKKLKAKLDKYPCPENVKGSGTTKNLHIEKPSPRSRLSASGNRISWPSASKSSWIAVDDKRH